MTNDVAIAIEFALGRLSVEQSSMVKMRLENDVDFASLIDMALHFQEFDDDLVSLCRDSLAMAAEAIRNTKWADAESKYKDALLAARLREAADVASELITIALYKFGESDANYFRAHGMLAEALSGLGRTAEAKVAAKRAVTGLTRVLGDGHYETIMARLVLGSALYDGREYTDAALAFESCWTTLRHIPDAPPRLYVVARNSHARCLVLLRQYKEAFALLQSTVREVPELGRTVPDEHALLLNALGYINAQLGHPENAFTIYAAAYRSGLMVFGEVHPRTAEFAYNAGSAAVRCGKYPEAIDYLRIADGIFRTVYGPTHRTVTRCLSEIGNLHFRVGDYDAARSDFGEILQHYDSPQAHPREFASTLNNLGVIDQEVRQFESAIEKYKRAIQVLQEHAGTAADKLLTIMQTNVHLCETFTGHGTMVLQGVTFS